MNVPAAVAPAKTMTVKDLAAQLSQHRKKLKEEEEQANDSVIGMIFVDFHHH